MNNYILRVKLLEGNLYRNVSKYGSMNPFAELTWNTQTWTSAVGLNHHKSPKWDDYHLFNSSEAAPLIIRVLHYSILFKPQEIGFCTISANDLFKGKTKEWVDIYYEGKIVGKVEISLNMYEEKRSDQSTLNTSYSTVDLKEEYLRKLNELELEKEELEFYRRKYKKKQQRLVQIRKKYENVIKECVVKMTPQATEESDEGEESGNFCVRGKGELGSVGYKSLGSQGYFDMVRDKSAGKGMGKDCDVPCRKGTKGIRTYLSGDFEPGARGEDILELKFEGINQFYSPDRGFADTCRKFSLDNENY